MDARSLVTVHIKLLGFLAQLAQQTEFELRVEPGSTVADLLYLVADRLEPTFRQALLDWHGNVHGGVEIILNQQHIPARKISEIYLWENCHVIIMPLIGGGRDINSIEGIILLDE